MTSLPSADLHHNMLGAMLVKRLPGASWTVAPDTRQGLFLLWLAFAGLMLFAAGVLQRHGVWGMLIHADPTYITLMIVLLLLLATVWVGHRAWLLGRERQVLDRWLFALRQGECLDAAPQGYASEYFQALESKGSTHWHENSALTDIFAERLHGAHEMAWWVNGIQLKLGLLGKVIGFSILALQIGSMDSFDPSQSQALLKNLTGGLGIALLTTMTGLTGNILLGLQLMRLDRYADAMVTDALLAAERDFPNAVAQIAKPSLGAEAMFAKV